jgi:molybdate transport system substrate-binding protein
MKNFAALLAGVLTFTPFASAETITIAAAADLKFAMDEIIVSYKRQEPDARIDVVYGSSGNFNAQIRQGAPFDLYFSADISYPRELAQAGWAASPVMPYAVGRLVLWSMNIDLNEQSLESLQQLSVRRFAIANPRHAPYGKRAEETLRALGVWATFEDRMVYGENIAQTAQFVQTGNAELGLVALSLVLSPELKGKGSWVLVPEELHEPLEQGYIITRRAAGSAQARVFADFMQGEYARAILSTYGFVVPEPTLP